MKKRTRPCGHCDRENCVLDENEEFLIDGTPYPKVPPGVFEVPVSGLNDLPIGQLLPHSSIRVAGLPPAPPGHEFSLMVTNAGGEYEDDYLSISAEVYLNSSEGRQAKLQRISSAYAALAGKGDFPVTFSPPGLRDRHDLAGTFSIDLAGQPKAVIREQIQPILRLLESIAAA
jgi:hypothetical protein